VVYYFPELLNSNVNDFKIAFKYTDEVYIAIGKGDKRYSVFDKLYSMAHNGADFEEVEYGESRYITLEEICKYFKI